ncbi:hypothetical protein niasHS_011046 [Heterodera schachtii]|uniref:PX domain-containing protein n=1 Tax=Heterodera schachtii TaxID=97005 RepID=A0ABD2ITC3_HETSC
MKKKNEPRLFGLITRYKELSALYSTLASIHRSLYLKGKFPSFAEPKYFGATDPQTIAERRNSIEEFLQFVLNNEVLCKSVKFQQFLETSIVVDKDPLKELKMMRRRLIQLTKRVSELETQNEQKNIERKVLLGIVSASTLLSVVLFVRTWLNR